MLPLYHVTLHRPDAITSSTLCNFTKTTEHLVLARGQWLEVLEIDADTERPLLVCRLNCCAVVRSVARLEPANGADQLAVSTGSALTIFEYDSDSCKLRQLGVYAGATPLQMRLQLPGEYLAVDPYGRAVFTAAIHRTKYVFTDLSGDMKPAEFVGQHTVCYDMVPADRGYENPAIGAIERSAFDQTQYLALYEFSAGLNITIKLWSTELGSRTSCLVGLPGGQNGPSGFVVLTDIDIRYYDIYGKLKTSMELEGVVFAQTIAIKRNDFFMFIQAGNKNYMLRLIESEFVLTVVQCESMPFPLKRIEFFKSGFVFAIAELQGDHQLYQVSNLEIDAMQLDIVYTVAKLAPLTFSSLFSKQQRLLTGTSAANIPANRVQFGLSTDELASTPLPSSPVAVFTVKSRATDVVHALIVLSFESSTITLAIGEDGGVEEISEASTGLATSVRTLDVGAMMSGRVQVHLRGLRYITSEKKVLPWSTPRNTCVVAQCIGKTQLALGLSDKSIVYFEEQNGVLVESQKRLAQPSPIMALTFAKEAMNELKTNKLFIASHDETVREFSLAIFSQKRIFNVPFPVSSLAVGNDDTLYVGHKNGTLSMLRGMDVIVRVLGNKPVQFARLSDSILGVSSRVWMLRQQQAIPLHGDACHGLVSCHAFVTEDMNGVVGVNKTSLEVFTIESDTMQEGISIERFESEESAEPTIALLKLNPLFAVQKHRVLGLEGKQVVSTLSIIDTIHAACNVRFDSKQADFLAVACGKLLNIYEYSKNGTLLARQHTALSGECHALLPFRGLLLAAIKNRIVMFEIGKKQLLLRDEIVLGDLVDIKSLSASKNLVYVGDSRCSVTVIGYYERKNEDESGFHVVGEDPVTRSVNAMVVLDLATVCIGDHYGNLAILRFRDAELYTSAAPATTSHLELVAHFWVPDAIVQLHLGSISPSAGSEAIVYTGLQGTVGVLIPFVSLIDYTSYVELEKALEASYKFVCGTPSITAFRSQYTPRRCVLDGDFMEQLSQSPSSAASEELGLTPQEIQNKIISIRGRV